MNEMMHRTHFGEVRLWITHCPGLCVALALSIVAYLLPDNVDMVPEIDDHLLLQQIIFGTVHGDIVNKWRLALLAQVARRGELLLMAQRRVPYHYPLLLTKRGISIEEATASIAVYQNLETIQVSEQWNYQHTGQFSTTAQQMLHVLAAWQQQRN